MKIRRSQATDRKKNETCNLTAKECIFINRKTQLSQLSLRLSGNNFPQHKHKPGTTEHDVYENPSYYQTK
jgi:hypothetical protein